ncbi:MAG: ATP-binding cassette domain-containing protein [Rhodocyclaceae bacterium]
MLEARALELVRGALCWRHDFRVARGQMLAITGPSGAGKSTLLECIAGFVRPAGGELTLDGESLLALSPERRPVAMLFQDHNLFEHVSIAQNLRLGFNQGRPDADTWRRVEAACALLGVADLLGRLPGELSGGQRQRVALVRTVLRAQPVIVLDEPFGALDADSAAAAGEWVRAEVTRARKIALFVTHAEADVERWADARISVA